MKRLAALCALPVLVIAGAWVGSGAADGPSLTDALNRDATATPALIESLTRAYVAAPANGRNALHLGLAHLWSASRLPREEALPHLVLAEHFLSRAAALRPEDDRIAGWRLPARVSRGRIDGDDALVAESVKAMRDAAKAATPEQAVFHSVPLAIVTFDRPADSPEFQEALVTMRSVADARPDQRAGGNGERWPHNIEGFMLGLADMELKAGNRQRSAVMLQAITQRPGYSSWRYKGEVEMRLNELPDRAKRYADGDPSNDPPLAFGYGGVGCTLCHGADERSRGK